MLEKNFSNENLVDYKDFSVENDSCKLLQLATNHYSIEIPKCNLYCYSVKIDLEKKIKNEEIMNESISAWNILIWNKFLDNNSNYDELFYDLDRQNKITYTFDGKQNLYTCRPLRFTKKFEQNVIIDYKSKSYTFIVIIKIKAVLRSEHNDDCFSDLTSINIREIKKALNIIFKNDFYTSKIHTRKGMYPKFEDNELKSYYQPIGIDKKAVFGHKQNIILGNKEFNLIIDRKVTAFYSTSSLVSFYEKHLESKQKYCFNKKINGLQVVTTHLKNKCKHKVFEITNEPIKNLKVFDEQKYKLISIVEYYKTEYGIKLNEFLPCLNVGDQNNTFYLPFEVCEIASNQNGKILSFEEKLELINISNFQNIEQRFDFIQEKLDLIEFKNKQLLDDFSIKINKKPIQVDGIQLLEPKLNYSNVGNFQPNHGKWDMKGKKVLKSVDLKLNELCVVNLTKNLRSSEINSFIEHLSTVSKEIGIEIDKPFFYDENSFQNTLKGEDTEEFKKVLDEIVKFYSPKKPKLILFLISKHKGDKVYKNIKSQTEINYGLITQCVLDKTVRSVLDFYSKNKSTSFTSKNSLQRQNGEKILNALLLKMNTKLGGTNCTISSDSCEISKLREDLMIIGADVTHPSEFDNFEFSVCSVVASFDSTYSQYVSVVKIQEVPRQEMITQMYDIVHELLELFLEKKFQNLKAKEQEVDVNDKNLIYSLLPQNIFFYRDGVSASQYNKLKEIEIKNMEKAFVDFSKNKKLNKVYNPKIIFIIVHKRQITRFKILKDDKQKFFSKVECESEKLLNVPSGTAINDLKIVKSKSEFFLCSNSCDQEIMRPTHYDLLLNESCFTFLEIQKFTYHLCFIFSVDTKSLSIPTPVKYAHLSAYRARKHLLALNQIDFLDQNLLTTQQISNENLLFDNSYVKKPLLQILKQRLDRQIFHPTSPSIKSQNELPFLENFNFNYSNLEHHNKNNYLLANKKIQVISESTTYIHPSNTSINENIEQFKLFYEFFQKSPKKFRQKFKCVNVSDLKASLNSSKYNLNYYEDAFKFYSNCFIYYFNYYFSMFEEKQSFKNFSDQPSKIKRKINKNRYEVFCQYLNTQYNQIINKPLKNDTFSKNNVNFKIINQLNKSLLNAPSNTHNQQYFQNYYSKFLKPCLLQQNSQHDKLNFTSTTLLHQPNLQENLFISQNLLIKPFSPTVNLSNLQQISQTSKQAFIKTEMNFATSKVDENLNLLSLNQNTDPQKTIKLFNTKDDQILSNIKLNLKSSSSKDEKIKITEKQKKMIKVKSDLRFTLYFL